MLALFSLGISQCRQAHMCIHLWYFSEVQGLALLLSQVRHIPLLLHLPSETPLKPEVQSTFQHQNTLKQISGLLLMMYQTMFTWS